MATDDPAALNAFLHRLLEDQESGRVQTLESYRALFPESAGAIDREFARLVADEAADAAREGSPFEDPSTIGPYRLLERLGQGSFGVVHRAEDTRLGRTVALKVLAHGGLGSERERAIFEREAAIASRLDHPGICTVFEVARHGPWTCIAMRLVSGEPLSARLGRSDGARLPIAMALDLIERTARALHAAHAAGVVHRDVKPGNIMVTADGEPVVVDFGLARDLADGTASVSRSGDVIGSPSYMAPEQIDRRLGAIDARTDVWALGVTLYECLAGVRPFDAATQAELFEQIQRREPESLRTRVPGLGRDLAVVVATALAKEPARRYPSANALADELARVRRGEPIRARPVGRPERLWRWARRNPALATLVGSIVLLLSIGLAVAGMLLARAETRLRDWDRLADGRRLADLQASSVRDLWPAVPAKVPAIEQWLAAARELVARRRDHEQALAVLRTRARPANEQTERLERERHAAQRDELAMIDQRSSFLRQWTDPESLDGDLRARHQRGRETFLATLDQRRLDLETLVRERLVFEFDDVRDQLQHDELTNLVLGLRRLEGLPGPADAATIPVLQEWRDFAATLEQRSIDAYQEPWREATRRCAQNARYGGLALTPQVGLIPLGPDPVSTLEEFCDTSSGSPPQRDAEGRLRVGWDTALVFVLVPAGTFRMGAQSGDAAAANHDPLAAVEEGPVHEVTTPAFFLSKYEMTQGQWLNMNHGNRPSQFAAGSSSAGHVVDDRHPVERVSHFDCTWVLRRRGLLLPTEAQWEYACRAGTSEPWPAPRADLAAHANLADRTLRRTWGDDYASTDGDLDDGFAAHAPVGSFAANAFGFHDMIGNVSEWCADAYWLYVQDGARSLGVTDPTSANWMNEFSIRGGSYLSMAVYARSSWRSRYEGTTRNSTVGVRPMRQLDAAR